MLITVKEGKKTRLIIIIIITISLETIKVFQCFNVWLGLMTYEDGLSCSKAGGEFMGSKHGRKPGTKNSKKTETEMHNGGYNQVEEQSTCHRCCIADILLYSPRSRRTAAFLLRRLTNAVAILEPFEDNATMGGEEGGEDKGFNRHKLDENVEGGARRVLERISNGVTNDSRLVRVRTFWAKGPGML
jgi:hypothetical protein